MNPRILILQQYLKEDLAPFDSVVVQYEAGELKIFTYMQNNMGNNESLIQNQKSISLEKLSKIFKFFGDLPLAQNPETLEIFNSSNHRRIIYLRLLVPECDLQISYDDETTQVNTSDRVSLKIQSTWSTTF